MEPSNALQPPKEAAYQTEGNPVTTNPLEQNAAHHHGHGQPVARRFSGNHSSNIRDAVPSSLGRGIHGAPAGEGRFGRTLEGAGRQGELEGEKMRAPAEGQVADAVDRKPGGTGSQPDLASDLDRKKREQAEARNAIKEERRQGRIADSPARGGVDTELDRTF
ncbi:hypothetical protein GGR51DRAFT_500223 [Nemania sp. FL0031]|nr:hypothetical protein GGR51DRAFT_500223 [Nemania sp. FL0031]